MKINFSQIGNQIAQATTWAAQQTTSFGRYAVQLTTNTCSSVRPGLYSVMSKMQNIDLKTIAAAAAAFAKSNLGIGFGLIVVGSTPCFMAAQVKGASTARKALFIALGALAIATGCAVIINPAFAARVTGALLRA